MEITTVKTNPKIYNDSTQVKYLNSHIQGQGGDEEESSHLRRASKKRTFGFFFKNVKLKSTVSLRHWFRIQS